MTTTTHDAVLDAMLAALQAAPALTDGDIAEDVDTDTLPEGVETGISLEFIGSQPGAVQYGRVTWQSTVRVSCRARRNASTAAGRRARALHASAYARLMADRTLGGVAEGIAPPRLSAEAITNATRLGVLHADYVITHRANIGSLDNAPAA